MSLSLQKADFWKRISAGLFDAILAFMIAIAAMLLFVSFTDYDELSKSLNEKSSYYQGVIEEESGVNLNVSQEEYDALFETQKTAYDEAYAKFNELFAKDETVKTVYSEIVSIFIVNGALGVLVGELIVYFCLPLLFKNGQTLGKKCFGLAVIRSNCVKISNSVLFIRCLVGRYAIDFLFPSYLVVMTLLGQLGIVGAVTFVAFAILQLAVPIVSRTNSCIHDLLADAIVVDMASQMIFETPDELVEYQKAEAARKASEPERVDF